MRIARPLLSTVILILFASLCASTATAQTWWVQSADYGAGNRRQDVTNTVRRLVSGPNFRVNNATLGGDPGRAPTRRCESSAAMRDGTVRDFKYGEGATVNSAMFRGAAWNGGGGWNGGPGGGQNNYMLQITSARWGSGSRFQNVTPRLQSMVRNNRLSVKVTPQNMGADPTPGVSKTLNVTYRCQNRAT